MMPITLPVVDPSIAILSMNAERSSLSCITPPSKQQEEDGSVNVIKCADVGNGAEVWIPEFSGETTVTGCSVREIRVVSGDVNGVDHVRLFRQDGKRAAPVTMARAYVRAPRSHRAPLGVLGKSRVLPYEYLVAEMQHCSIQISLEEGFVRG